MTKRVTVKIPRLITSRLFDEVRQIKRDVRTRLPDYLRNPDRMAYTFRLMFKGLIKNLVEARFSKPLDDLVIPTYFSLLGIVNLQATAQDHELKSSMIIEALTKHVGCDQYDNSYLVPAGHTFQNKDNYGFHNGRLKFLDYGSRTAVKIMLEHREAMRAGLDEVADPKGKIRNSQGESFSQVWDKVSAHVAMYGNPPCPLDWELETENVFLPRNFRE